MTKGLAPIVELLVAVFLCLRGVCDQSRPQLANLRNGISASFFKHKISSGASRSKEKVHDHLYVMLSIGSVSKH